MEHPIQRIIREKGITLTELSILCGTNRSNISHIIKGNARGIAGKVLQGIEQLGYNPKEITAQYDAWREHKLAEIREKVLG